MANMGPLAVVTFLFIVMCTLYEYPNGMEWQNRFMLKLNPILFGGAAIFLRDSGRVLKCAGWVWLVTAACLEFDLYRRQLPAGMNFYLSDFSDHTLMFPQTWGGTNMTIFYLPLIAVLFLSTILWLRIYWTICKAQSSSDP